MKRVGSTVFILVAILILPICVMPGEAVAKGLPSDGRVSDTNQVAQVSLAGVPPVVSCGMEHTAAVKGGGSLSTWGWNTYFQLGDGTNADKSRPTSIGTGWATAACGSYHTAGIKSDGSLWAWGDNSQGAIGDGTTQSRSTPTRIGAANDWATVACGWHTIALKTDGSLWAWGDNDEGQVGDGTREDRTEPTRIGTDTDWAVVACGYDHTLAIKSDGSLWAWGNNNDGELGDGTRTDRLEPTRVGTAKDWMAVATGRVSSLALKGDGSLWGWGGNSHGEVGDGTWQLRSSPVRVGTANDWVAVASGQYHSVALKSDGSLWSWGYNDSGQLGYGNYAWTQSPVQVGTANDWTAVACGGYHTFAIKGDGSAWGCGAGGSGALGDGTWTDRTTFTNIVDLSGGADTIAPRITSLGSSTHPDPSGWYTTGSPSLLWSASDTSGVAGYSYALDRSPVTNPDTVSEGTGTSTSYSGLAEGTWYFHLRSRDSLGNWSATRTFAVHVDATAPTSASDAPPGWQTGPVTVTITPADGASGVAHTFLSLDGKAWTDSVTVAIGPRAKGSYEGTHTLRYYSVDVAGNAEAVKNTQVKVDLQAPVTYSNYDGAAHAVPYTLTLTTRDPCSGVASTRYRVDGGIWQTGASVTFATNGLHVLDYYSTDNVGHVESVKTQWVRIGTAAASLARSQARGVR